MSFAWKLIAVLAFVFCLALAPACSGDSQQALPTDDAIAGLNREASPCKDVPPAGAFQMQPPAPDAGKLAAFAGAWEGRAGAKVVWLVVESIDSTGYSGVYSFGGTTARGPGIVLQDGSLLLGDRGPIQFKWALESKSGGMLAARTEGGVVTDGWSMTRCRLQA